MSDFYDGVYFLCTLIESIGRDRKLRREDVIKYLTPNGIDKVLDLHTVYHCLPLEQATSEFVTTYNIPLGDYDNVDMARELDYNIPSEFSIGMSLYLVLKEFNVNKRNIHSLLDEIYNSKVIKKMSDYSTDIYTTSTNYLVSCIKDDTIYAI